MDELVEKKYQALKKNLMLGWSFDMIIKGA